MMFIDLYKLYRFLSSGDPDALGSLSLPLLEPIGHADSSQWWW